ncbi:hypothetical protein PR048_021660 [Dryococelus australis]|uniref:Uncharacterized protein n=1 Tax=Dryococelus australis TaxID=614101 RepID=A0ABQ9GZ14_9NEOP|nr:hypothetical protein PR048_021660 [Dryococelus australis]
MAGLFVAMYRDLYNVKTGYEEDHLQFKLLAISGEDFDIEMHREKQNEFKNAYFLVMVAQVRIAKSPNKRTNFSNVELPHIMLPTFPGKLRKWICFLNLFAMLVVENKQLTRVENTCPTSNLVCVRE